MANDDIESECAKMDVNLSNKSIEDASSENQQENLSSTFKYEGVNDDQLNYHIGMNNNSSKLEIQSPTFEMDIQEEVVVTTSTKANDFFVSSDGSESLTIANDIGSMKKKIKVKHKTHSHMKRRRTMDEGGDRSGKIVGKHH